MASEEQEKLIDGEKDGGWTLNGSRDFNSQLHIYISLQGPLKGLSLTKTHVYYSNESPFFFFLGISFKLKI